MHYQHFRNDFTPAISTVSGESGRLIRSRKFPLIWLDQYKSMHYGKGRNIMFCKLCRDHGLTGQWCTGTSNFRKNVVCGHLASKGQALSMAANKPAQPTIFEEVKRAEEKK